MGEHGRLTGRLGTTTRPACRAWAAARGPAGHVPIIRRAYGPRPAVWAPIAAWVKTVWYMGRK
jgi:hypothetical protein